MLDELCSGMIYSVLVQEFNVNESHYTLNKISLSRNTHKIRLPTDLLMKM